MRRPPLGAVLDRRHPLAHGLVAAWLFNEGGGSMLRDVVQGFVAKGNVAPTTGWSHGGWYGQSYRFPGAAPAFTVTADPRLTPQAKDPGWTVILRAHFEGANYTNRIGVNCENRWRLLAGDGNGTVVSARWGASWVTVIAGGPTLRDRVPFDAALRWSRGQNLVSVFHNGVRVATSSQGAPPTTPVDLVFGNLNATSTNWWLGNIYHVYIYNVPLSDGDIATLAADPYGMFRGPVQRKGPSGVLSIQPTGIPSAEAFGLPTLSTPPLAFIQPTGIPSAEAFGVPTISRVIPTPIRYVLAPGRSQAQMAPSTSHGRPAPTATAAPVAGMTTRAAAAPSRTRSRE
jgi:hypothetical protein